MRPSNNIKTHIKVGFAIIVLLSITLLASLFIYQLNIIETRNVTERLNVAIETAWDQFDSFNENIEVLLFQTVEHTDLKNLIEDKQLPELDQIIRNLLSNNDNIDYLVLTDSKGEVLSGTNNNSGETWFLNHLLNPLTQKKSSLNTYEILPKADLYKGSVSFQKKAQISYVDVNDTELEQLPFNEALLNIVAIPVFDSHQNIVGCLAAGMMLNNNQQLPKAYTDRVPNTYLSVGVKGIRISSNISLADFHYPKGSAQEEKLIQTTEKGNRYNGKIYLSGQPALIVVDPIRNYTGDVIGNMGVGAPVFAFREFDNDNIILIILTCFFIYILSLFLSNFITQLITKPIYQLQSLADSITANQLDPADVTWHKKNGPIEIQQLAESMLIMAANLKNEKLYLEDKVTERTQELISSVAKLRSANKYKSQFLANMSHELRTPLNSIIGFSNLLKDKVFGELNSTQIDYLDTVIDSSNNLLDLINDILDLVKLEQHIESLMPTIIDLNYLIDDVVTLFHPQIEAKSISFDIFVEDKLANPQWDKQRIRQVLINLISNAIKFTPSEGTISFTVCKVEKDYIKFELTDSGIGIPPDMKEKVFLAFEQADASFAKLYRGVGLGLSISKRLVELHDGIIWLEDNPKGGTIACVKLPIKPF